MLRMQSSQRCAPPAPPFLVQTSLIGAAMLRAHLDHRRPSFLVQTSLRGATMLHARSSGGWKPSTCMGWT